MIYGLCVTGGEVEQNEYLVSSAQPRGITFTHNYRGCIKENGLCMHPKLCLWSDKNVRKIKIDHYHKSNVF